MCEGVRPASGHGWGMRADGGPCGGFPRGFPSVGCETVSGMGGPDESHVRTFAVDSVASVIAVADACLWVVVRYVVPRGVCVDVRSGTRTYTGTPV